MIASLLLYWSILKYNLPSSLPLETLESTKSNNDKNNYLSILENYTNIDDLYLCDIKNR